jgi:hypothetical protein
MRRCMFTFMTMFKLSLIKGVKKTVRNEKMHVYFYDNVQIIPDQRCYINYTKRCTLLSYAAPYELHCTL